MVCAEHILSKLNLSVYAAFSLFADTSVGKATPFYYSILFEYVETELLS